MGSKQLDTTEQHTHTHTHTRSSYWLYSIQLYDDTFICSSKHKYIVGFQYFVFSKITVNYNSYQHCFIIARA